MPLGLVALALGAFGIGLTEFVILGLLPEVAAGFAVTESVAGWLVSGYALSVTVGGLILTATVTRFSKKRVLVALLVPFIVGNLMSATAPTYEFMLAGRVIAALCHGAFFGIGTVVASTLVGQDKQARAVAIFFTGGTTSTVLGVPFGTLLGQALGWRSTFWAITAIGFVALVAIAAFVPNLTQHDAHSTNLGAELRVFKSAQVWLSLAVTVLGFGGVFATYTYIAYTLTDVSNFARESVPWLLILFGVGMFVGGLTGGRLADRSLDRTVLGFLSGTVVTLICFALFAEDKPVTVLCMLLLGIFSFGIVPPLQTRIMQFASSAPTLASGANIAGFNAGNALGAWVGGLTISAGLGYASPSWAGAALTAAGLIVMGVAAANAKRSRSDRDSPHTILIHDS